MSNAHNHCQTYRIKTVAHMTGLSTHVIRKWEERYNLVRPDRSSNGYRTYREDDIQFLLYLKSQLGKGESIGQLAQQGERHLRQTMRDTDCSLSNIPNPYRGAAQHFIQSSKNQDYEEMQRVIAHWIQELGLEEAMDTIFFPLLRLIGDLWHEGKISHSAEHHISRIIRQQVIQQLRMDFSDEQKRALIACTPGEYHEIAPLTATFLLQKHGWHATYLGPNISFEVLLMALRRRHPALIILSSTTEPDLQTGQTWLETIIRLFQPHCRVMVGGTGFCNLSDQLTKYKISYLKQVKEVASLNL